MEAAGLWGNIGSLWCLWLGPQNQMQGLQGALFRYCGGFHMFAATEAQEWISVLV